MEPIGRNGTIQHPMDAPLHMTHIEAFPLEKDLVAALHRATPDALATNGKHCSVFREVQVMQQEVCIPDLVLIYHDGVDGLPPRALSYYEAAILHALTEHAPATARDLATSMYCRAENVDQRLRKLERRQLVVRDGDRYALTNKAIPVGVRVIAIEAKLKVWRRAIEQARNYLAFAHEAFIAMPVHVVQRPVVLAACREAGVGVLAVHSDGSVLALARVGAQSVSSTEYLRLVSATIGLNPCMALAPPATGAGAGSLFAHGC